MNMKVILSLILVAIISVPAFIWFFSEKIQAGYEGIVIDLYWNDKGVNDYTFVTGRTFYNPFTQDIVSYPLFVQTQDFEQFQVNAKDWSMFTVDPTIQFQIEAGKTPIIYTKYRKDIGDFSKVVIGTIVKDAFRIVLNKYTTDEILYKRSEIESEVIKQIGETTSQNGIKIEQITSGIQYPESIIKSITSKNTAVQEAQKVENQLKIAEAEAKIKTTNATADAEVALIKAKAEAQAFELKTKSLSENLIKQQFIEKWNGQLPTYGEVPQLMKSIQ